MQMDAASLRGLCREHRGYQTPSLNDKLYANFRGFTSIAALEPYTGLRALFLEGNALNSAAGLPPLPELRCLFLQQNALASLAPGAFACLPQLDTLNVACNALASLEGLEGCAGLRTLVACDNHLAAPAALAPLAACTQLESLDLQNNALEDGAAVLALLAALPALKCLYLRGNPLVSRLRSYRKAVIAALPGLTYLDDRPVAELERVCAEAWASGGLDAERAARAAYHQREQEREQRQVAALRVIREAGWRKRREQLGLAPEGGDPYLEGVPSDPELEEEEPVELRQARDRLAAFTAAQQAAAAEGAPPGLAEADVEAVLEDSRASRAALLASAEASAAGSGGCVKAENSCPNSACMPAAAATCDGCSAGDAPAPPQAVPEARTTELLGGAACAGGVAPDQQCSPQAGEQGTGETAAACTTQATVAVPAAATAAASTTDSRGGGELVSLAAQDAEEDSEEACLDELD